MKISQLFKPLGCPGEFEVMNLRRYIRPLISVARTSHMRMEARRVSAA